MKIVSQQFPVPADLQPYIQSFWYFAYEGPENETSPLQYCLATGLVEIIIHVTPPFSHRGTLAGREVDFPEAFLGGMHVEPVTFRMRGGTGIFGISCKPEAPLTLFNQPIGDLVDDFAELHAIFGKKMNDLVKRIQDNPCNETRVRIATEFFRHRVAQNTRHERYYLSEALQYIRLATGQHTVDDLCGKVFVGKRQLQRSFQENIGISPKTYGRIVRFKGAYDYVQRNPRATWTEISHQFGYSDQSHLIRDFREFTGENPTSFLTGFAPMPSTPLAVTA